MYFDVAMSARLAAIEQYHGAASLLLQSSGRVMNLFAETARVALKSAETGTHGIRLPNLFLDHLHAGHDIGKDWIRLLESQLRTSSHLVLSSLEKAKGNSPVLVELAIDNVELALTRSVELMAALGDESQQAMDDIEAHVARKSAATLEVPRAPTSAAPAKKRPAQRRRASPR